MLALGLLPAPWLAGHPLYGWGLVLYDLLWLGTLLVDVLLTPKRPVRVEREVRNPLTIGEENPVSLRVRNLAPFPVWLWLKDDPPDWAPRPRYGPLLVGPGEEVTLSYTLTPFRRGQETFGAVSLRSLTRWALGVQQWEEPLGATVQVYPNLREVQKFHLLAHRRRLEEAGLHWTRLRGQGTEFESLRDYQPDDDARRIHWKATARRAKLTAIEYQVERSQPILLALDCGRLMATPVNGLTKLDHAINAALMLAYVAAWSGDQVGLLLFAEEVLAYHPPRRGLAQVYRLAEELARVQGRFLEPDYLLAFEHLQRRLRRRSLVVFFTDFWDVDSARPWLRSMAALAPRHLPLFVTFADPGFWRVAHRWPEKESEVFEKALALRWLEERAAMLREMRRQGLHLVEATPQEMAWEVVRRYLDIKARSLL